MAYRRKSQNQKMEDPTQEEKTLPTVEEIEENIKKVIEIDKMLEETLEKLETLPSTSEPSTPTGKIFIGEEDKRLFKKFNQHIIKKLGLSENRSFKL